VQIVAHRSGTLLQSKKHATTYGELKMLGSKRKLLIVLLGLSTIPVWADTTVITFEGLADGTSVTNQFSGVTFSSATVLTAGVSLNELEFPPKSGTNVVFDDGGPMAISFATPLASFAGFFTYGEQLTLVGFDASGNVVGTVLSMFDNNLALSGDPGSTPNEQLQLSFAGGISSVLIEGDPSGGSFVLDDATLTTQGAVPEPGSFVLLGVGSACLGFRAFTTRIRIQRSRKQPVIRV
jgi:hypothetical protein